MKVVLNNRNGENKMSKEQENEGANKKTSKIGRMNLQTFAEDEPRKKNKNLSHTDRIKNGKPTGTPPEE